MPYIRPEDRIQFDEVLDNIPSIQTKGELEYCIFKLMTIYMEDKDWKYTNLHDTVYAAQHCADEYRRRFLDDREDSAIEDNGDIK